MKELLLSYTEYNVWANTKIAGFIKLLTPEQLDMQQNSSFPTIRKTLMHIWDSQIIWLLRLNDVSPDRFPSVYFTGTITDAADRFVETSQKIVNHVLMLNDKELIKNITYKNMQGIEYTTPAFEIIMHCMNHSTFHRGQLITMMRNAGFTELSSTDLINFFRHELE